MNEIGSSKSNNISNMYQAINNAQQKIKEKKMLNENFRTEANKEEYTFKNSYFDGSKSSKSQIKKGDDIFEKYGKIMTVEEKKRMKEEQLKQKEYEKLESLNILIQPEGKFVTILPGGAQVHKETGVKLRKFKAFNLNILSGIPLDLKEEEPRELKAINGYNYEYKKILNIILNLIRMKSLKQ